MRPEVTSSFTAPLSLSRRSMLALTIAAGACLATPGTALSQAVESSTMLADEAHGQAVAGEIVLVDIRTPGEWAETGIGKGAIALDMREESFVQALVALRLHYPDKPIAMICRTGNRSGYVIDALARQGFTGLVDVTEGMAGGPNGTGWLVRELPTYAGTVELINERLIAVMP